MVTNLSNFTSALSTLSRSYSAIRLHQPVAWARKVFQSSSKMVLFIFMGSSSGNAFSLALLGVFGISFPGGSPFPHAEAKQNFQTHSPDGDFIHCTTYWDILGIQTHQFPLSAHR